MLILPKVQLQKVRKVGALNHVKYDVNTFQPRKHVLQETVKFCFCSVNKTVHPKGYILHNVLQMDALLAGSV